MFVVHQFLKFFPFLIANSLIFFLPCNENFFATESAKLPINIIEFNINNFQICFSKTYLSDNKE